MNQSLNFFVAQHALKQNPYEGAFQKLLELVQFTFLPAQLYGFAFYSNGQIWAFGKDLSFFDLNDLCQQYTKSPHKQQYFDIVVMEKKFKIFDLPLWEHNAFILFFFTSDVDTIFSVIRFKQAYEKTAIESDILEELLNWQKMKKPHPYLKELFTQENSVIWYHDTKSEELGNQSEVPLTRLSYCGTILSKQCVQNVVLCQTHNGPQIYAINTKPAEQWDFLSSMPFSAAIIDENFYIHIVNSAWHNLFKRTHTHLSGFIPESDMQRLRDNFRKKITMSSYVRFSPDVFIDWYIRPYKDNLYLLTAMAPDLDTATLQHLKSLEERNEMLKQFAHLCAHDMKEPLRAIGSYVQLLLRKPEKREQFAQFIINSCHSLKDLIDAILVYSTCENNSDNHQLLNLNEIIETAVSLLYPQIVEREATIRWEPQNPIHFKGSRGQLIQVFQNIIGNAIKFTNEKPVVHIEYHMKDGHHIFSIRDFGVGIQEHLIPKAFELFSRLNDKGKFAGSGIGLSLCRKIIDFHKGSLTIIPHNPGIEVLIVL